MADEIFGQMGYSRSLQSFGSGMVYHMADKLYGDLVGSTDSALRAISEKTGVPYIAPVNGYLSQLAAKTLFRLLFSTKTESIGTNVTQGTGDFYVQYNPKVSKEVFFKYFKNEFVNTNRFYVEFIDTTGDSDNSLISAYENNIFSPVGDNSGQMLETISSPPDVQNNPYSASTKELKKLMTIDNYKILLNYLVDNIQFPNFQSKKASFTRMGQTMEFVNNQEYNGDLTITFTYDMRGNIDRFLHYISEQSKYFSYNDIRNGFDIRITTFKPLHYIKDSLFQDNTNPLSIQGGNSGTIISANDFKIDTKTFKNIQMTSKPNYQLSNSESNIIHRTATFSYLGVQEKVYDWQFPPKVDFMGVASPAEQLSEFMYDMYENVYEMKI